MNRWHFEFKWRRRKWPLLSIGVDGREFILILWALELSIWRL
jgi:hypothetical protein